MLIRGSSSGTYEMQENYRPEILTLLCGDGLEAVELLEVLPELLPDLGLVHLLGAALLDLDGEVVHGPGHRLLPHLHQPLELQHPVLHTYITPSYIYINHRH
jgi:hypothetical protein